MMNRLLITLVFATSIGLVGCSSSDSKGGDAAGGSGGTGGMAGMAGEGGSGGMAGAGGEVMMTMGRLEASEPSFQVPNLPIGQRTDRTIEITNSGDAPVMISDFDLEIAGGEARLLYGARQLIGITTDGRDVLESEGRYPVELSPGVTLALTLEFVAGDMPTTGALTITGDFEGETLVIPVEAIESVGTITADPVTLDFGRTRNMTESTINITIRNTGMAVLNVTEMKKTSNVYFHVSLGEGDPMEDETLYVDPDGDGNPGVAPGSSFDLAVRFAPTREGTQQSTIIIDSDDPVTPELRIPLLGNPVTGCIMVSHESVMWEGTVREITPSPEISITNCGDTPLTLDQLGLLTGSSANFEFDALMNVPTEFPAEVPVGADPITFRVNYGPPDARRYRGNIEVLSNDPDNHTILIPLLAESPCATNMDCAKGYSCEDTRCIENMPMME